MQKLTAEEIADDFEEFLQTREGEVTADVLAQAWNKLSDKYEWLDRLSFITPSRMKKVIIYFARLNGYRIAMLFGAAAGTIFGFVLGGGLD